MASLNKISRRAAIGGSLLATSSMFAANKKGMFDKPLGLQLYTLRFVMPNDAENTLKTVAEIGFKELECLRKDMAKEKPLYDRFGLKAVSAHVETPILTGGPAWPGMPPGLTLDAVIEDCKNMGLSYLVAPYVQPKERGDLDYFRKFADDLNRAGEKISKAGMTLCYHNHAFEFKGDPGQRVWDVMVERFDKKNVQFELDLFWTSVAGQVPSDVLKSLAGRVPLVHLKDKGWGTPTQFTESVKPEAFKEVGAGTMDFPAILRACAKSGVKHYFVEQDQTPKDPLSSIRLSYTNLRNLKVT